MKTKNQKSVVETPVVETSILDNIDVPYLETETPTFDMTILESLDVDTLNKVIQKCLELKKKTSTTKQAINQGVGNFIKERILNGMANKDILKEVEEHYGNKNTTYACVAWYRNDLKNKGLI